MLSLSIYLFKFSKKHKKLLLFYLIFKGFYLIKDYHTLIQKNLLQHPLNCL